MQDEDGCPDTGGLQVVTLDGDRMDVTKLPTLDHGGLSAAGTIIVQEMALTMLAHPEITKWLIAIALPNKADAEKLGDAIKARLAQRNVTGVDILAAAGPAKLGAVVQERADANAPMVCPANLVAKPRPAASLPAATPDPRCADKVVKLAACAGSSSRACSPRARASPPATPIGWRACPTRRASRR